jgi:multidrug efflux pump subunit AcrA (membrane-fusion protein)
VRAGEPLVELDARQLGADRRRAAAALVAAEQGARAAEADVRGVEATRALARATRDRIASLFERRSATPQERDDADAAFGAAEARSAGAHARVAEAAAAVDAARAAADAAAIAASYAVLAAPFDGTVAGRHIDPGAMAVPGAPLLTIEDGTLQFETRLDESRAAGLSLRQPLEIRFDSAPDAPSAATVIEIGRVDPGSHSFIVTADLPGGAPVRSGMFGRAVFEGAPRRALVVPASAVVRRGQLAFVFTVEDGAARLRPVSLGPQVGARVEVTAGIPAGDLVVTDPPASLVDGAAVDAGQGAGR